MSCHFFHEHLNSSLDMSFQPQKGTLLALVIPALPLKYRSHVLLAFLSRPQPLSLGLSPTRPTTQAHSLALIPSLNTLHCRPSCLSSSPSQAQVSSPIPFSIHSILAHQQSLKMLILPLIYFGLRMTHSRWALFLYYTPSCL